MEIVDKYYIVSHELGTYGLYNGLYKQRKRLLIIKLQGCSFKNNLQIYDRLFDKWKSEIYNICIHVNVINRILLAEC